MLRGRNGNRKLLGAMAVMAALVLFSCGRNWCIGPFGPCEQYTKMDPAKLAAANSATGNLCGWATTAPAVAAAPATGTTPGGTTTVAPATSLTISANPAALPVRLNGPDVTIYADGGATPYTLVLKDPSMGTLSPGSTGRVGEFNSFWRFRPTKAGLACLKVLSPGMTIDSPCAACWMAIPISP